MDSLWMGKINTTETDFVVAPDKLRAHIFVTGQSGCGKSSLVSRLVEEIVLRDAGSVLLFDYNHEFSKFAQIDEEAFDKSWNKKNCPEDNLIEFKAAWEDRANAFKVLSADAISISYRDISSEQKALLYGIDPNVRPGAYWLIQLIDESPVLSSRIKNKKALAHLISDVERWFEGRPAEDDDELGEAIHQLRQHVDMMDLATFVNGAQRLRKQPYVSFKSNSTRTVLNEELFRGVFHDARFCVIDLLNFKYEDRIIRDFVAMHAIHSVWRIAREQFRLSKADGDGKDNVLFLVIDEAHNIVPNNRQADSGASREIIRLLKTVAAEGRKFGLFLVLISQRPNKIDESVLSECDNFIVMKSTPPTIKLLKKLLPLKDDEENKLDTALELDTGRALYAGKYTDYRLVDVDGDIKRTK